MNPWRRGSVSINPYARTAFRIARVAREEVRHKSIVQRIGQTRRLITATPQGHEISGKAVTVAELNSAEQVLLDARQRIVEEFLEHASEPLPLQALRRLSREVAEAMRGDASTPLALTNLRALHAWADQLAAQLVREVPAPDPSFGALELESFPPFGPLEE